MDKKLAKLFDEAICLEINVAQLYDIFRWYFPDDDFFWARLSMEERNHAALLEAGKNNFKPQDQFPDDILPSSIKDLSSVNLELSDLIDQYNKKPPSREEAFNIALDMEKAAGEFHFQKFMGKTTATTLDQIFQKLNMDDKDHAKRIHNYMAENGIAVK